MGFTCLLVGIEEELPGLETLQDLLTKHAARLERKSGQHKARVFCNGSQILHFGQRKLMEIVLKSTPFGACVSDDSRPPCLTARPLNPAFTGCYPICGCDPQQEKHHGQNPKRGFATWNLI